MSLATATILATDKDILEIVKENPLPNPEGRARGEYGDLSLTRAVQGLADIAHPWTVPKMIDLYRQETSLFTATPKPKGFDWNKEQGRCRNLATLLAASRDPRAAMELMHSMEDQRVPNTGSIVDGLTNYFLQDSKYRRIEQRRYASTNMLPEMKQDVENWWKLNNEQIEIAANAMPH